MKTNSLKFWNKASKFYAKYMNKNVGAYLYFTKVLQNYLNKEMQVLELGCGTGELSVLVADNLQNLIATDFSEGMIRACKNKNLKSNIIFKVEDACNLSFKDNSFDAVLIANVLHIVSDMDLVLSEIRRVLKKNGIVFAPIFVYNEQKFNLSMWFLEKLGFKTYHKFSSVEYVKYLEDKGYDIIYKETIKAKPLDECIVIMK